MRTFSYRGGEGFQLPPRRARATAPSFNSTDGSSRTAMSKAVRFGSPVRRSSQPAGRHAGSEISDTDSWGMSSQHGDSARVLAQSASAIRHRQRPVSRAGRPLGESRSVQYLL